MNEVLKYLGEMLRRTYGAIVEKPMPWRMIDKLAALEEAEEEDARRAAGRDEDAPGEGEAAPHNQQTD